MDSNVYTGGAKHFPNKEQQDQSGASKVCAMHHSIDLCCLILQVKAMLAYLS